MAQNKLKIGSTKTATMHGLKCLIYGMAGVGKTRLAATTGGSTIILSAEAGLLSLREYDIPVATIASMDDLREAYQFLVTDTTYQWVILDSISEIGEVVLEAEKAKVKDPRLAYSALSEQVEGLVKAFRDMPGKNVIMIAKAEKLKDEATGAVLYQPSLPGKQLAQKLPYLFDLVLYQRSERDKEGNVTRFFQTAPDFTATAKDRSGALDTYEPADLKHILSKIKGGK